MIALSAVIGDARQYGAQKFICLGDVVGYGPEPEKVASTIRRISTISLAGNHDDAVIGRLDPSDFIDLAADAVARHRDALSSENIEWLKSCPYLFRNNRFACAHGSFVSPKAFGYITNEAEAAASFKARKEQLLFVGHTHIPGIFVTGVSGKVYALEPTDFMLEDGKRYIINPGSVGYPRSEGNICESTYVLFDDTERSITFRRIPFRVRSVMQTGRNPKRLKKRTITAIVLAAALATGAAVWMLTRSHHTGTLTEIVTNTVTTVIEKNVEKNLIRIDRSTECIIPEDAKHVHVQIRLDKGSPAAQIQLAFRNSSQEVLWEEHWMAKRSKKAKIQIPPGATRATLSAGRMVGDAPATFGKFSLYATP